MTEQEPAGAPSAKPPKTWGEKAAMLGVACLATSIVLVCAGVPGATMHDTLQFGGLALMIGGWFSWRVLKK